MARSFSSIYISLLRIEVEKELENNPHIVEKLGIFKEKFIKWCANERYQFEPDLEDEYMEFTDKFITKRLQFCDIDLWKEIRYAVFKRDNYKCSYCGQVGGVLEVDHIIPISKNGSNELTNLTTSCKKCNRQKKDKTVDEFLNGRVVSK